MINSKSFIPDAVRPYFYYPGISLGKYVSKSL